MSGGKIGIWLIGAWGRIGSNLPQLLFQAADGESPDDVAAQRALLYDWTRRVSSARLSARLILL
jgi:hypothetical protein